jgi:PPOX class probable F420-dependent enzyme
MGITIGPRLRAFFEQRLLAVVCTLNQRGTPEMTPIWYEYNLDDRSIWFNGDQTRQWLRRMAETGRATFYLQDPENGWRWAQVYGRVIEVADDPQADHFAHMAERYGRPLTTRSPTRRYIRIEITSVKGRAGTPSETWDVSRD